MNKTKINNPMSLQLLNYKTVLNKNKNPNKPNLHQLKRSKWSTNPRLSSKLELTKQSQRKMIYLERMKIPSNQKRNNLLKSIKRKRRKWMPR